jgi:hypothetical protein
MVRGAPCSLQPYAKLQGRGRNGFSASGAFKPVRTHSRPSLYPASAAIPIPCSSGQKLAETIDLCPAEPQFAVTIAMPVKRQRDDRMDRSSVAHKTNESKSGKHHDPTSG